MAMTALKMNSRIVGELDGLMGMSYRYIKRQNDSELQSIDVDCKFKVVLQSISGNMPLSDLVEFSFKFDINESENSCMERLEVAIAEAIEGWEFEAPFHVSRVVNIDIRSARVVQ